MDLSTAITLLSSYRDKKRGMLEASFVDSTIEYIQSEAAKGLGAAALEEPSVASYLRKAQLATACGWTPFSDRDTSSTNRILSSAPMPLPLPLPLPSPSPTPVSLTLYSDGSCLNNGRRDAKAGYAVVAIRGGKEEHRYVAPIPSGEAQTNQRAELRALDYAIRYIASTPGRRGVVHTDSRYSIDCITKWAAGWEKKGWKKADGGPVLHLDLIKPLVGLYRELPNVTIHHVAAHTGRSDEHSLGNALVDELARSAAEAQ